MPKEFFTEQPTKKEMESKLEELEKYPDLRPRLTVAWPVTKEKEELLEMLDAEEITKKEDMEKIKELQKSDDFLDKEIGSYLSNKIEEKKNKPAKRDKKIELLSKLLSARKPLFATPHIPQLAEKISTIEKASTVLQKKYKDRFIGIIVFGSTHKGYSGPKSDIDYMLGGQEKRDRKLQKEFKKLTKNIELCFAYNDYLGTKKFQKGFKKLTRDIKSYHAYREDDYLGKGIPSVESVKNLFHGIFFGNHQKLLEFQKQTLEKINKDEWNFIRELIKDEETTLGTAARRFDIKDKNLLEQIKANIAILRTPPPLGEAREIINKRYEQEVKK